jgi:hypothetical protein
MLKYLKKKSTDNYGVTEQRHNNLSIIDKVIKIICDEMRKNNSMANTKLTKFIKTFKGRIHQTTRISQAQM